jgi:hypothetical protein
LCRFTQTLLQPRLQDGKCHLLRNWLENPIMTLFPTDGVLLEVRNQKKKCHA